MQSSDSDDESKSAVIRFRLTSQEKERFKAAAKQQGLDLSNWIRWLATNASREVQL